MKRIHIIFAALLALLCASTSHATVVIAADTGEPLPQASVFNSSGAVAALSDNDGLIPRLEASAYPLRVRFMGFLETEIVSSATDTVRMAPASYPLAEVTVSPEGRPVSYLRGYMREYSSIISGTDSLIMFTEHYVDFMTVPDSVKIKKLKGWSSPRTLARETFARMSNDRGLDSIVTNIDYELMSWSDMASVADGVKVPENILNGAPGVTDSVPGKYWMEKIWRKTPAGITLGVDMLASHKEHRYSPWYFKLFGMTIDCTTLQMNMLYDTPQDGTLHSSDLQNMSFAIEMDGRGKLIKKVFHAKQAVDMRSYSEIYITDRSFLTPEEAREIARHPSQEGMHVPTDIPPLDAPTLRLIDRVKALKK